MHMHALSPMLYEYMCVHCMQDLDIGLRQRQCWVMLVVYCVLC